MRCLWSRKWRREGAHRLRQIRAAVVRALAQNDRGTVTAEFAIIFPTVIAVAVLILGLTRVILVQLNCQDAARQAAYAVRLVQLEGVSQERSVQEAVRVGKKVAGDTARVDVQWQAESFTVLAACPVLSARGFTLPVTVHAQARGVRHEIPD
ncbi:TadE/TadG family type IV pilus assembly protein [Alloscardovia macacae]|uniref:Pilus assembly protein TadE n=1 Tax=Alloscardovia macacae TaxID=1160091 RepID=A0A261F3Y3_9BIFI|nr:TadE/TadG family type IV pilus assembly protein [Alloscardovia macacae]OZG53830.1 pilus assembly protein TadE [Alloscardovia macacae]